jgi:hypothetical protein
MVRETKEKCLREVTTDSRRVPHGNTLFHCSGCSKAYRVIETGIRSSGSMSFRNQWWIATRKENVSGEELSIRMAQFKKN